MSAHMRLTESELAHHSRSQSESSSGSTEEPGRRQQLETLLEKTDEDVTDECFVPSSKTVFYLSESKPVLSSAANLSDCNSAIETGFGNEFVNVDKPAKGMLTIKHENEKQWTVVIVTAVVALSCTTTSSQFVRGFAIPLVAIIALWCCLELIVLRLWRKVPLTGSSTGTNNVRSLTTVYQLCGCGCIGECVACCFASLFPDYLCTLIVLCSIGFALRFISSVHDTVRISVSVVFIAICRAAAQCISVLPVFLAPFTVYGLGVIVGIFLEHQPNVPPGQSRDVVNGKASNPINRVTDAEFPQSRERRPSMMSLGASDRTVPVYCTSLTSARGRRISLPSLSMNRHRHSSGSMPSYEAAVIAEAHGIITDMLVDGTLLPPHIASGLRAVASLLEQPGIGTPSSASARQKNGPFVSLSEVCSDTEESPFTGERPNVLPKRFRRSLPLSLLRRMSTSTWTTTTSATGLPTLEAEPSRKRSTSFRTSPASSPGGSRSHSPSPAVSPNPASDVIVPKQRSLSTIIPSRGSPINMSMSRKYHRSTIGSISVPDTVLSKSVTFNLEPTNLRSDANLLSEESRPAETHLLPAIRRINLTSDYESSESPSNSEYDESAALLDELASQNAVPAVTADAALVPEESNETDEQDLIPGRHYRVGNITYDLEAVDEHPLLNQLLEWDFPVFDLYNEMGDRILSQVAYKIFQCVGLFDTFRIPVQEFLNYFHTLEMGYRDKPYHNRIHAADVLHGVYFLSSQPIPGFVQIPWHETPKVPKNRPSPETNPGDALPNLRMQYANGSAENDIYGIMGCNLPPLELMALYTAAAMHDYDHPGRTNAFLVATCAPQAILYNDRSVLENHHAAAAWRLLLCKPEFNWLCHLEKPEWKRFRYLVIEAVLATDLKRHFEIIAEFNSKASDDDAPGLDWTNETDRLMACQMCIKLADINGPCKRKDLHLQWTYRITEEFFEQGDEEAGLGLPISPYMDRNNPQLARLQESFINHLVAPLCNAYGEAGLLPGRWRIFDEPDDRSGDNSRKTSLELASSNQIPEDSVAEDPPPERIPLPRIECVLTEHLKSNHDMWVIKVKEEERLKEERAEWDSKHPSRKNSAELP